MLKHHDARAGFTEMQYPFSIQHSTSLSSTEPESTYTDVGHIYVGIQRDF